MPIEELVNENCGIMNYAEENTEVFNKWFACGKISVPSDSLYQWENISPLIFPRRI